jgi:hypothetical protein
MPAGGGRTLSVLARANAEGPACHALEPAALVGPAASRRGRDRTPASPGVQTGLLTSVHDAAVREQRIGEGRHLGGPLARHEKEARREGL